VRMTAPLERVLRAFLDDPAAARYGYDLMRLAGLQSGTLYPLLARLEDQRLVSSAWETPQREGQRPRKYYRLTGEGIRVARIELARAPSARHRGARDEERALAVAAGRVPGRARVPPPAG
jgi:PadR family transcriptional regulator, regulatory protein PadR